MKEENLTKEIISAFYRVYNVLGHGFVEKVYQSALMIELENRGLKAEREVKK